MQPILSILTPACWERIEQAQALRDKIAAQIAKHDLPVEHLVLLDNRTRTVGEKRQALVQSALGGHIAFVDDDDDVSDDYVARIVATLAKQDVDVVTFEQEAHYNAHQFKVIFGINNDDAPYTPDCTTINRAVWHVCPIRRSIAQAAIFPAIMDGEDRAWSLQVRPFLKTSAHISRVLHIYRHNTKTTLASGY